MFEIGSSLRQARERRGLALGDVERATRIRSRYLRALEEERFDVIPGLVYAKGFLRTYADYLELDGGRFVAELTSRLRPEEDEAPLPPAQLIRRRRVLPRGALVALGAAAIAAAALIWVIGAATGPKPRAVQKPAGGPEVVRERPPPRSERPVPQLATLVLRAVRAPCWVEAHAGSETGPRLYYSTLEQGGMLRLRRKRLWVRLGAPTAVVATLNGRAVSLPDSDNPTNLVITRTGAIPSS